MEAMACCCTGMHSQTASKYRSLYRQSSTYTLPRVVLMSCAFIRSCPQAHVSVLALHDSHDSKSACPIHAEDYGIYRDDSTMTIIGQHAIFARDLSASASLSCTPACWIAEPAAATPGILHAPTGVSANTSAMRRCINSPDACSLGWTPATATPPCATSPVPCQPLPSISQDAQSSPISLLYEARPTPAVVAARNDTRPTELLLRTFHGGPAENTTALLQALTNTTSARGLHLWGGDSFMQAAPGRLGWVYASEAACCIPGSGAFEQGCGVA